MAKMKTRQRIRNGTLLLFFVVFPVVLNYLSPFLSVHGAAQGIISGSLRVQPLYDMDSFISVDSAPRYIIYFFVLAAIMVPALAVGRRTMCHSICWMAPFMILGRKLRNLLRWPALRLKAETADCAACGTCNRNCVMSLDVQSMVEQARMEHAECILCGRCVDSCPQGVIRYSFSRGV